VTSVSARWATGADNYRGRQGGVIGFSKSLAREIGSRGVTVNCVAPGFIETDMTKALPRRSASLTLSTSHSRVSAPRKRSPRRWHF